MFLLILLGVAVAAALLYYYINKRMNYFKTIGVPQGHPKWLLGHTFGTLIYTESWRDMLQRIYYQSPRTRYTGMYHLTGYPILVIKDPELLRQMFIKDFEHFTDHLSFLPAEDDLLWSKNLFALEGKKWREMRTVLSPVFTSSKLRSMYGLILESSQNFIKYFLTKDEDVITIETKDVFGRFAADVIATTACGIKVNSLTERENEFYRMGQEAVDFSGIWKNIKFVLYGIVPPIRKILAITLFSEAVKQFFSHLIDETIRVREEKGVVRPDLIQLLLEARKGIKKQDEASEVNTGFATAEDESSTALAKEKVTKILTNEDITAQALVFFIAGFDTVSSIISFATYEIALNPDVQEKLRDEIKATWTNCGEKLTYEAILGMKYLDMVVSETLRKWPNLISADRICTKPYTIEPKLPGEVPIKVEKGLGLWLPIYSLHHDPEYFPNPEKFDPERFSDENKSSIRPYTYLPFGIGPRNCIGSRFALLEIKLVLFHVLLHFELVPVEKTDIPMKISKKVFALTAENGIWLGMKKIKKDASI